MGGKFETVVGHLA